MQTTLRRHPVLWSAAGAVLLLIVLWNVGSRVVPVRPEWPGHLASHLATAVPMLALLGAARAVRAAPRRTAPGRPGRRVLLAGMWVFSLGQLTEVVSAPLRDPFFDPVHTAGQVLTLVAMAAILAGVVLSGIAGARDGVVPRWAIVLAGAAGLMLILTLFGITGQLMAVVAGR